MVAAQMQDQMSGGDVLLGQPGQGNLPAQAQMAAVLAGARARGVADTLDLLGIAAILVDADGIALHVNRLAGTFMGAGLGICARQLVAATYDDNARLQQALDWVLANGGAKSLRLANETSVNGVTVQVLAMPPTADDSFQLLKAVILLEQGNGSCGELALATRLMREAERLN